MKKIRLIAALLLAFILIIGFKCYFELNKINHIKIDRTNEALGINEVFEDNHENKATSTNADRKDIISIALFGLDGAYENSRSDSIMILTIDFNNKKVKLISLMRDMYISIEGYDKTKLNHAYAYGGAELAIKTINQNFGTDIKNYAAVNFYSLEKIIDILGGVSIEIKKEEIPHINNNLLTKNGSNNEITVEGKQLLNGNQALAYARVRYLGNGDFDRTERQRKIIAEILNSAKEKGVTDLLKLIEEILPLIETSMDKQTIVKLSIDYLKAGKMTFEQERFPIDSYCLNDMIDGIYYLKFDEEITKKQIMNYIYYDEKAE